MMDGRRFRTILVVALLGCASKPVTAPRAVVPEPAPSELRAAATPGKRFGHMVALGIGVSNGAAKDYVISADRVLAVDREGNRVAPLSVAEAARPRSSMSWGARFRSRRSISPPPIRMFRPAA